jgi:hypothetical protein
MELKCATCGKPGHVYLHRGNLYCRHHVPCEELDLSARADWMMRRAQLNREEVTRKLEAILVRRAHPPGSD